MANKKLIVSVGAPITGGGGGEVDSVNGKKGVVVLDGTDVETSNGSGVTVKDALDDKADKSNVLELDNTSAFTPSEDYEPATKKYVDDNTGVTIPNAAYNVVGGVKMSRDSASSTTYISFDGTDTPNVT